MDKYIISEKTLAVIGLDYHSCRIIEESGDFTVSECWQDILNNSCLYYSSSLRGRLEASRVVLNKEYKVPIMMSEFHGLVFFPIGNQTNYNCIWLSLKKMESYSILSKKIKIHFNKNVDLVVCSGKEAFENQLLKAYNLEKILISRYKKLLK